MGCGASSLIPEWEDQEPENESEEAPNSVGFSQNDNEGSIPEFRDDLNAVSTLMQASVENGADGLCGRVVTVDNISPSQPQQCQPCRARSEPISFASPAEESVSRANSDPLPVKQIFDESYNTTTQEQIVRQRLFRGQCPTCTCDPVQRFNVTIDKSDRLKMTQKPLSVKGRVYRGECLVCKPELDPRLCRKTDRRKRGYCQTCGRKCFERKQFKMIPITSPARVLKGRCLNCKPRVPKQRSVSKKLEQIIDSFETNPGRAAVSLPSEDANSYQSELEALSASVE